MTSLPWVWHNMSFNKHKQWTSHGKCNDSVMSKQKKIERIACNFYKYFMKCTGKLNTKKYHIYFQLLLFISNFNNVPVYQYGTGELEQCIIGKLG